MLWLGTAAVLLLAALIVGLLLSGWGSKDRGKVEPKPPAGIKEQPKPAPPAPLGKNDTNSIGMKFVRVPGGTFWQGGGGGTEGTAQAKPMEEFYLAIHEVTQGQWKAVMGKDNNPSYFSRTGDGKAKVEEIKDDKELDQFPVENVRWTEAKEFIEKLNAMEKGSGWLYRLPTEAEWEYGCRGGPISKEQSAFDFYFDEPTNDLSSKQANFDGTRPAGKAAAGPDLGRPCPVGSYKPNRLGLYDMHGNVWEWCEDTYEGGGPVRGPVRVSRGGGWHTIARACRAGPRSGFPPSYRRDSLGFRVARVPSGGK